MNAAQRMVAISINLLQIEEWYAKNPARNYDEDEDCPRSSPPSVARASTVRFRS